MRNIKWVLAKYAEGQVTEDLWSMVEEDIVEPGVGQVLVENLWVAVEPYMRGKLAPSAMALGAVMEGPGIGRVVASAHPSWSPGDLLEGPNLGWQRFAVVTPDAAGTGRASRVDPEDPEPQSALSWCGMPGYTAYFAMLEVGRPKPGDTTVVSAAGGAVGQIAGQLARHAGSRVIGIAGSREKLEWCREIGFDDTIDYRESSDLAGDLRRVCPEGIDVFFDGTGGAIHDAVLENLAVRARVAIVGRVAISSIPGMPDHGVRASSRLIQTRATVQGFSVYDWWERRPEAARRLRAWRAAGRLQFREDIADGIEAIPSSFVRMMRGESRGKQLVRL